jgi:Transcription factor WhiB
MTVHSSWRDDAACRDADPDLFFPVGTTGPAPRHIDEAKRICRACPRPSGGLGAGAVKSRRSRSPARCLSLPGTVVRIFLPRRALTGPPGW